MPHSLAADPDAARGSKLLQTIEPELPSGINHRVVFMFRRAQINKLVRIVRNAFFTHNRQAHDCTAGGSDGKPIRGSGSVEVVCSFATTPAVHVLDDDCGISTNMFLEKREHSFNAEITGSTRRSISQQCDRLALVKIVLSIPRT